MFLFHKPRQHSSCVPMLDSNLTPNSGHAIILLRMRKWPSVWWLPLTIIIRSISFYKMMWMLRVLWLVVAHNLLEYMDNVTEDLFYLFFFSTWRAVLKMFVRLLWIKQVKVSKKSGAICNEKNGEMEAKRALDNLRMSKLQEIFTTVAIVCRLELHRRILTLLLYCIVLYFSCISVRVRVQFYFEREHFLFIYLIEVYI